MCRAPFVLKKSFILCFFTVIFYFKNQGNNQNNFKKIKKVNKSRSLSFLFFVFFLKFLGPSLKKIWCFSILFFQLFFQNKANNSKK